MPKKPAVDSKTDLATTTDEYWHTVFKLPAMNFINLFRGKIEDFDEVREIVRGLGCYGSTAKIIGVGLDKIDDPYFGPGIKITVHESFGDPYQSRCYKCNLHYDTGES